MTCPVHTYFQNTMVPGGSLSTAHGELEAKKSPHQHTGALGVAPKLFLAQVSPALFKDSTQMSPESPKLSLVIPTSLLLGHVAYARRRAELSLLVFPLTSSPTYLHLVWHPVQSSGSVHVG